MKRFFVVFITSSKQILIHLSNIFGHVFVSTTASRELIIVIQKTSIFFFAYLDRLYLNSSFAIYRCDFVAVATDVNERRKKTGLRNCTAKWLENLKRVRFM